MTFRDQFGWQSGLYARYRPGYPAALFDYLAGVVSRRRLAWDCGTGNGQAAVGLSAHFDRVIATDASRSQLAHVVRQERIEYVAAQAEAPPIAPHTVDLITAAQAMHWFDLDRFFAAVREVARPDGVAAAWCYGLPRVTASVDRVIDDFYHNVTAPYWESGRRWIDENYLTIPFPFDDLTDVPKFEFHGDWSLEHFLGYLESWSACATYQKKYGHSLLDHVREPLRAAWGGDDEARRVRWPIYLRVGRM